MASILLTILTIGMMNIYADSKSTGQLIWSLLKTDTNRFLSPLKENPLLDLQCPSPWVLVGTRCVFVDLSKDTSFDEGRNFCTRLHTEADLATFRDANEFYYLLQHLKAINSAAKRIHFWIGGRDKKETNNWTWVDGQPMPMGSPYWGVSSKYVNEPQPENGQYCAFLYQGERYYIHDIMCGGWEKENPIVPICQYDPFTH